MSAAPSRRPRLAVLYLWFDTGKGYDGASSKRALRRALDLSGCEVTFLSIRNSPSGSSVPAFPDEIQVEGNNAAAEFSGWQCGIDALREQGPEFDAVLFVNDRWLHRTPRRDRRITASLVEYAVRHAAVAGSMIALPVAGSVCGHLVRTYARTHFFLVPRCVLEALDSIVMIAPHDQSRFFPTAWDRELDLFREDSPVSKALCEFIFRHLTEHWYQRRPYDAENFDYLRRKATAVLNSMLFTCAVRELGFPLVSFDDARAGRAPTLRRGEELDGAGSSAPFELNFVGETARVPFRALLPRQRRFGFSLSSLLRRRAQLDHL